MTTEENHPLKVIIIPAKDADREKRGEQILRAHGCHIEKHDDRWEIFFPDGTTRQALDMPAIIRARFLLPDGLVFKKPIWSISNTVSLTIKSILAQKIPDRVSSKFRQEYGSSRIE